MKKKEQSAIAVAFVREQLIKFGYLKEAYDSFNHLRLVLAITEFQEEYGLELSGVIDNELIKALKKGTLLEPFQFSDDLEGT